LNAYDYLSNFSDAKMQATAKLFTTGKSQAVRLPKAFRLTGSSVWIHRDEVTGDIILRPKQSDLRQRNLQELLQLVQNQPNTEEFIPPRDDAHRPNGIANRDEPPQP
jgi:antitoxin VapB